MARYGAKLWNSPTNPSNTDGGRIVGKNSEVFTSGDPVSIGTSGLYVATTGSAVYGVVVKTATMTSTNDSVALVKPLVIPIDQDYEWLMGTNGALSSTTSVGVYFKLIGGTGAVQVDVSTGAQTTTSRVVVCTKVDPQGTGATTEGLFKFTKVTNLRTDSVS